MNTTIKISLKPTPVAPSGVGPVLTAVLADEYVLYLATRDYRWKATGPDAARLCEMFGAQIQGIDGRLDRLAWQIGATGDWTRLGPAALAANGRFTMAHGAGLTAQAMLAGLCDLHDEMIVRLRTAVAMCTDRFGDAGTGILLADLLALRERDLWMLRALRWELTGYHERDTWLLPATPWEDRMVAVA